MEITEKAFETHIVNHLSQVHDYRLRVSKQKNDARDSHYQKFLCLDWEILLEFITATQPDSWKALEKQHGTATVRDKFLQRLTREIERRGTWMFCAGALKTTAATFNLPTSNPSALSTQNITSSTAKISSALCASATTAPSRRKMLWISCYS
ncbi:MAG: hypothetical protein KME35_19335 [Aphanocapsa sp. GSE-SYN-MK-11-07L]|jgi:type I restriction enzyme R subunit|nr:hypothetical protein [Aphanocapsa sp. GSE-SYN-MK-11-07L]